MRNRTILYIITLPDLGGAQVHLYEVISKLPKNIIPYVIIGKKGWLSEALKKININLYIISALVRQISPKNDIKAIWDVKKIIREIKPDIVHCHSSKAGCIGRVAAKFCNVSTVFTAHGWAFTEGVSPKKQYVYKNLEKMMAKWTRKIICVSEYDRQIALKVMPEYKNKLVTIHNGIPDKDIAFINQGTSVNLVMIARFSPPKNQQVLIQALSRLCKEGFNFNLTFVGDGPKFALVKQLAEDLNLNQSVEFLGARTDVEEILAKQDIFLLISNWEGFPISILEAMRQSLPVVASDVGGVGEAIEDRKTGFLIPRGDIDALVDCLKKMYEDKNLRDSVGHAGRICYEQKFTSEKMMQKILKVYEEVLKG